MKFYSLNKQSPVVNFREAAMEGQAPDRGLYFPEKIPQLDAGFIQQIEKHSNESIAVEVIRPYVGDCIPRNELQRIVEETVNFDIPLVKINDKISSLELFHGPTLAFKDMGARFMSRCLGYFARDNHEERIVLVATSGDTGGAVADGFYKVEGVKVVILYPSGKVSNVQESQLTSLGNNIHALEIDGTFDDCQQMVKGAFMDEGLKRSLKLTSANSINVARWLPQQFYYFFLWKQWADKNNPPVVAVPSGNFGNICAGLLASASGLPIKNFIAACNANDTVPRFFETGTYEPHKTIPTLSNAMDVSDPSNFVRILEIFQHKEAAFKAAFETDTITDEATKSTLLSVFEQDKYLLDPHGAVAHTALNSYLETNPAKKGVILETAHPVKFYDVIEPITHQKVPVPAAVKAQLKKRQAGIKMNADPEALKSFLLEL